MNEIVLRQLNSDEIAEMKVSNFFDIHEFINSETKLPNLHQLVNFIFVKWFFAFWDSLHGALRERKKERRRRRAEKNFWVFDAFWVIFCFCAVRRSDMFYCLFSLSPPELMPQMFISLHSKAAMSTKAEITIEIISPSGEQKNWDARRRKICNSNQTLIHVFLLRSSLFACSRFFSAFFVFARMKEMKRETRTL